MVFSAAAAEAATQVVAAEIAAGGASPLASKGRRVGIKFLVQVGGSWIPRWYMGVVIHKQGEDMHVQLDGADGDTAWVKRTGHMKAYRTCGTNDVNERDCRIVNVHKCNGNVCNVCRPYAGLEEGVDVFLGFRNVLCFPKSLELTTSNVV